MLDSAKFFCRIRRTDQDALSDLGRVKIEECVLLASSKNFEKSDWHKGLLL